MSQSLTNRFFYRLVNFFYNRGVCKRRFRLTVDDGGIKGLKPPFIALSNHTSNNDVFVAARALKRYQPNYVGAMDQISKQKILMRFLGAIPKRQFASEISAVKNIKYVLDKGRPVVIFPEGKLSVDGRLGYMPFSVAKLVKLLGVPVVTVKISGNYLGLPRWSGEQVHCPVTAKAEILFNGPDLKKMSAKGVFDKITAALDYDEFAYQRQNNISVVRDVEGVQHVLYRCPECKAEFEMRAEKNRLACGKCGAEFVFDSLGGITGAGSLPLWYGVQRQAVKEELIDGKYLFRADAEIFELPDINGYRPLGKGAVTADGKGVLLEINGAKHFFKPENIPTIPFEGGKRFYLSTTTTTFRIDVLGGEAKQIVKLNLALEENYKLKKDAK